MQLLYNYFVLALPLFFFSELLKSVANLIDKDTTVYFLNNTKMGLDVTGRIEFHNSFNTFANNLWKKGEVDSSSSFTLTSLTAQKNLIGISAKKFGLVDKGM